MVGKEIGSTGTIHLQGYIEFRKQERFNTVKGFLPGAHIEVMAGTPLQASEYCKKDNDYFEVGRLCQNYDGGRGVCGSIKADRYRTVIRLAKEGHLDQIESEFPGYFFNNYVTIRKIQQDYPQKVEDAPGTTGIWLWGPTGVGKSRKARALFGNTKYYDKPCNKWWDGYQGEPIVLMDDFDKSHHVLRHHLNRWADRYSFPGEQKGTTKQFRPEKIIVTSNWSIEQIWTDEVEASTIRRRFVVTHMTNFWQPAVVQDHVSESLSEEAITESLDLDDL